MTEGDWDTVERIGDIERQVHRTDEGPITRYAAGDSVVTVGPANLGPDAPIDADVHVNTLVRLDAGHGAAPDDGAVRAVAGVQLPAHERFAQVDDDDIVAAAEELRDRGVEAADIVSTDIGMHPFHAELFREGYERLGEGTVQPPTMTRGELHVYDASTPHHRKPVPAPGVTDRFAGGVTAITSGVSPGTGREVRPRSMVVVSDGETAVLHAAADVDDDDATAGLFDAAIDAAAVSAVRGAGADTAREVVTENAAARFDVQPSVKREAADEAQSPDGPTTGAESTRDGRRETTSRSVLDGMDRDSDASKGRDGERH